MSFCLAAGEKSYCIIVTKEKKEFLYLMNTVTDDEGNWLDLEFVEICVLSDNAILTDLVSYAILDDDKIFFLFVDVKHELKMVLFDV